MYNVKLRRHDFYNYDSTSIQMPFDRPALRPFDDRAVALTPREKSAWLRLAGHVTVSLVTFDKQTMNIRRIDVES